jgi:hypothetical protein
VKKIGFIIVLAVTMILVLLFACAINAQSYGTQGTYTALKTAAPPSYGTAAVSGNSTWMWTDGVTCWYGGPFTVTINITQPAQVTLYLKDDDNAGRIETIAENGGAPQTITNFAAGSYQTYQLPAGVTTFVLSKVAGPNAVLTSIFFDPSSNPAVTPAPPTNIGVSIVWNESDSTAVSFNIYRNGVMIANTSASPFKDTIAANQPYTYAVSALNSAGVESTKTAMQHVFEIVP